MKKKVLLYLALVLFTAVSLVLNGCSSDTSSGSGTESPGYRNISADELKSLIETNKDLLVVDVREQVEYDQGHLADSLLIPTSEFTNRLNELPKEKAIALVCATGARSAQAAQYLAESGYTEVYNLTGGVSAWPDVLVK